MRTRPIVFFLFLGAYSVATGQFGSSRVVSAKLEDIATSPDQATVHMNIRNTSERPITAFSIVYYQLRPNGERTPCGGRGADMIDWSDPMPGRNIYVHMRRNWIPPNGTVPFDGYPRCPGGTIAADGIHVELDLVLFDDGTGEGDSRKMELTLGTRQQARDERLKWIGRFTALRNTPDLRSSAQGLYQDLVDAARSAEINPENASRQGMAKPVREELQSLALDITQWAAHTQAQKNEMLDWRITDLEQRTARLVQGAGKTDAPLR